jgi:hypothetical protein
MSCWTRRARVAGEFGRLLAVHTTESEFRDAVLSVLHLHANRLIGLDRSREARALAIVRERVHSLTRVPGGGIENAVQNVDDQVGQDDEQRGEHHHAEHHG